MDVFPLLFPQEHQMATDEVAVDHRKDPLGTGDMDLSGEEQVPKVRQGPPPPAPFSIVSAPRIGAENPHRPACSEKSLASTLCPTRRGSRTRSPSSGRSGRRTSTGASSRPCSCTAAPGAASKVRAAAVPVSLPRACLVTPRPTPDAHPRFFFSVRLQSTSAPRPPCKSGATRRSSSPRSCNRPASLPNPLISAHLP